MNILQKDQAKVHEGGLCPKGLESLNGSQGGSNSTSQLQLKKNKKVNCKCKNCKPSAQNKCASSEHEIAAKDEP